jgi:hypothetical protein
MSMHAVGLLVAVACVCAAAPLLADEQAPHFTPGPEIDRMSEWVLLDACGYLRSAKRFSVDVESTYEDVLTTGTRVEYNRQARVVLERPDHLRIDSESDKGPRSFYYDAKTVTLYHSDEGIYAVLAAPPTIDAVVDAVEANGVSMPASDLLLSHPCQALGEHLQTGVYAGRHYLDGNWYHHLLLSTDAVDVQLWVGMGEVPEIHKLVITYTDLPDEPRYSALLRDWNFDPAIDGSTFTFTPPAGVHKVAFLGAEAAHRGDQ